MSPAVVLPRKPLVTRGARIRSFSPMVPDMSSQIDVAREIPRTQRALKPCPLRPPARLDERRRALGVVWMILPDVAIAVLVRREAKPVVAFLHGAVEGPVVSVDVVVSVLLVVESLVEEVAQQAVALVQLAAIVRRYGIVSDTILLRVERLQSLAVLLHRSDEMCQANLVATLPAGLLVCKDVAPYVHQVLIEAEALKWYAWTRLEIRVWFVEEIVLVRDAEVLQRLPKGLRGFGVVGKHGRAVFE